MFSSREITKIAKIRAAAVAEKRDRAEIDQIVHALKQNMLDTRILQERITRWSS